VPDWIAVVILGVIEGLTEFLPVSSTGHLLLAENTHLLPQQSELFNIVIQAGAVLAVFLAFSKRIKDLALTLDDRGTRDYLLKLTLAFGLTAVGGLLAKKAGFSLPKGIGPITWATLIGGVVILAIEWWARQRQLAAGISWTIATLVGLAQFLAAVFPGTSRAGSTILIALAMGVSRPAATEFSFLLGIPTLFAASGYEIYKALEHPGVEGPTDWGMVALGSLVSAVVAFLVVKWLVRWVQTHTFVAFGWYRVALGVLMLALASRLH
jgi:undecaprenyl-diphosphatase